METFQGVKKVSVSITDGSPNRITTFAGCAIINSHHTINVAKLVSLYGVTK